jgi:ribosome-binding protein aMBF1 (putative translation factor)
MECEICLRTTDEGFELVRVGPGMYLCRDCEEIHNEIDGVGSYIDEAMTELKEESAASYLEWRDEFYGKE